MNDGSFKMFCLYNIDESLSFNYVNLYLESIKEDIKHFSVFEKQIENKSYKSFDFNVSDVYAKMFLDKIKKYKQDLDLKRSYKYRRKTASIEISKIKHEVFKVHGKNCLCCGSKENISIDHVLPVKLGGSNKIENLQPLCLSCNSKKNIKIIDYRNK